MMRLLVGRRAGARRSPVLSLAHRRPPGASLYFSPNIYSRTRLALAVPHKDDAAREEPEGLEGLRQAAGEVQRAQPVRVVERDRRLGFIWERWVLKS